MAKKHSTFPKGMIIYTILVCVCVGVMFLLYKLTWNLDGYWDDHWEGYYQGDILGMPFDFIKHNWHNFTSILLYVILPISLLVLFIIVLFKLNSGKYVGVGLTTIHFLLMFVWGIAILVFIILLMVRYTAERAFFLNFCFNVFFVSAPQTIYLMYQTCFKCGFFNMKQKIREESHTEWKEHHSPGGYRNVSVDIKDQRGNKVGSIETQRYEEGRSYTTATTTTTYTFVCKHCEDISQDTWTEERKW